MARGTTLVRLLDLLRVEMRLSLNSAHNAQARDTQVATLQREQERLWDDFDWPHLRVERTIPVEAGQRRYDPPSDMLVDRIERIEFKTDGEWLKIEPGIDAGHYAVHDSDLDERSWPVCRWRIWEDEQIEIWPIPDTSADATTLDGYLKVVGIRNLQPLVADSNRADLDDRLLVLFTAGALLTDAKAAEKKLATAAAHYARLRSRLTKQTSFQMFGTGERPAPRRPIISRYRAPT